MAERRIGGKCERCNNIVDGYRHSLYYATGGRTVCWDCVKFEYPLGAVQAGGLGAGPQDRGSRETPASGAALGDRSLSERERAGRDRTPGTKSGPEQHL